jgi:hypothetical protein
MEGGVLQTIREKMSWLPDKSVIIQHDGGKPHTGKDNEERIEAAGSVEGWKVKMLRQPA